MLCKKREKEAFDEFCPKRNNAQASTWSQLSDNASLPHASEAAKEKVDRDRRADLQQCCILLKKYVDNFYKQPMVNHVSHSLNDT